MCLSELAQRSVEHTHIANILRPNPGKSFKSPTAAKVGANTLAEQKLFAGLLLCHSRDIHPAWVKLFTKTLSERFASSEY